MAAFCCWIHAPTAEECANVCTPSWSSPWLPITSHTRKTNDATSSPIVFWLLPLWLFWCSDKQQLDWTGWRQRVCQHTHTRRGRHTLTASVFLSSSACCEQSSGIIEANTNRCNPYIIQMSRKMASSLFSPNVFFLFWLINNMNNPTAPTSEGNISC